MSDNRVFKDYSRAKAFWSDIKEVIDRYPEVLNGMDVCYEYEEFDSGDRVNRGKDYNPSSPKYIHGLGIVLNVMNLDQDEATCTLTPPDQSRIVTRGLMCNAH